MKSVCVAGWRREVAGLVVDHAAPGRALQVRMAGEPWAAAFDDVAFRFVLVPRNAPEGWWRAVLCGRTTAF